MTGARYPCLAEARQAMGTRWEVLLPGEDTGRLRAAAEEALDLVESLERQLSVFRPESEICGLNARAAGEPVRVEPRLFALLRLAVEVHRNTDGAFDPTTGPLLRCWGFRGGEQAVPEPAALEEARAATGAHLLELDAEAFTLRYLAEGVCLDLGAIGKGYAVDRALEVLEDAGVEAALLHAGTSTLYGMGAPPGEEAWRVALRDPLGDEAAVLAEAALRGRALSVSGPHNRAFTAGDRLYGHVLDPRTGEPTRGALLAAAAHPCAALTDALSTALLVLGPGGLPLLAERYPDADFLLLEPGDPPRARAAGPDAWRLRLRDG